MEQPDSPKRNYKKRCDKSGLLDWTQITLIISEQEGRPLSRQAVLGTHERLLKKLSAALCSDPYVKDWMADRGLEIE
jgi:hypothetical protein